MVPDVLCKSFKSFKGKSDSLLDYLLKNVLVLGTSDAWQIHIGYLFRSKKTPIQGWYTNFVFFDSTWQSLSLV